ncbi:MAG: hypothetical protein ACK587_00020 [Cyanobacteriota bacterium]
MAEGSSSPFPSERHRSDDAPRGERSSGPREGGFRIRLSDNEMRSARALQEAFGLRSTVAVLGFALRTLGQQLDEGKLTDLVEQHRAQAGSRGGSGEGAGRSEGRRERSEGRGGGGRWQEEGRGGGGRPARVDPFARPPRPEAVSEAPPEPEAAMEPPADELDTRAEAAPAGETIESPAAEETPVQEPVAAEAAESSEAAET